MEVNCKRTEHKSIYVEPKGEITWESSTGVHWNERVEHPATVHVLNAQGHHTSCYSVNGGPECPETKNRPRKGEED